MPAASSTHNGKGSKRKIAKPDHGSNRLDQEPVGAKVLSLYINTITDYRNVKLIILVTEIDVNKLEAA